MEIRPELEDLNIFHYLGILAAIISGFIHLYLVPSIGLGPLGIGFLVAGLGFFAGSLAILYNFKRSLTYLLGIPFTAGQIILWYYLNKPSLELFLKGKPLLDFIDKVSQTLLLAVLIYLYFEGE
ncbi:MAG: hypothetical protein R6V35_01590 [Candidatus Nanohaloarchaea archaeon]